jgi:hypothetical protein
VEHLKDVIKQADQVFIDEDELSTKEKESYDADSKIKEITDRCIEQIYFRTKMDKSMMSPEMKQHTKRKCAPSGSPDVKVKEGTRAVRLKRNIFRSEDTPDRK